MPSIFTQIRTGKVPGFLLADEKQAFAILDKFPVQPGHTLVIPKHEYPSLFEMPQEEYLSLLAFAQRIAQALQKASNAKRVGMVVEGFGIKDHAHIHLVPLYHGGQLNPYEGKEAGEIELAKWQKRIKTTLESRSLFE